MLRVENLSAEVDNRRVLNNVSVSFAPGELVVLFGPNGSGKSSLARVIMGDPRYKVVSGQIILNDEDITDLPPEDRAKRGIFLAFQSPVELEGVTLATLLLRASGRERDVSAFPKMIDIARRVGLDPSYLSRPVNKGFSGGERKRSELLQALFLDRKYLILDEIDSGVDVDGLRLFSKIIQDLRSSGKAILLISHNPQLLRFLNVDRVYVMRDGRIEREGGFDILKSVLAEGFDD